MFDITLSLQSHNQSVSRPITNMYIFTLKHKQRAGQL